MQITPALKLGSVTATCAAAITALPEPSSASSVTSAAGEDFECELDLFDAEKDRFPYCDERFSTVLCGELIEHLFEDPMHLMAEVNRILKPGGHLVLTTPTSRRCAASRRFCRAIIRASFRPISNLRVGRSRAPAQPGIHSARDLSPLRMPASRSCFCRPGHFASSPGRGTCGSAGFWIGSSWIPRSARMASTPWDGSAGRSRSVILPGCTPEGHERRLP